MTTPTTKTREEVERERELIDAAIDEGVAEFVKYPNSLSRCTDVNAIKTLVKNRLAPLPVEEKVASAGRFVYRRLSAEDWMHRANDGTHWYTSAFNDENVLALHSLLPESEKRWTVGEICERAGEIDKARREENVAALDAGRQLSDDVCAASLRAALTKTFGAKP